MRKKQERQDDANQIAKVVNGKLVLSLPEAETPVVWQMDLGKAQSAAFTVVENKDKNVFNLVLKTEDGRVDEIAPFQLKAEAVDALMQTSQALQNADHGAADARTSSRKGDAAGGAKKNDTIGAVLAVILVILLLGIWYISAARTNLNDVGGVSPVASNASNSAGGVRDTNGVAVSADDFLSNR